MYAIRRGRSWRCWEGGLSQAQHLHASGCEEGRQLYEAYLMEMRTYADHPNPEIQFPCSSIFTAEVRNAVLCPSLLLPANRDSSDQVTFSATRPTGHSTTGSTSRPTSSSSQCTTGWTLSASCPSLNSRARAWATSTWGSTTRSRRLGS